MLKGCGEGQEKLATLLDDITATRNEIKEITPKWITGCEEWIAADVKRMEDNAQDEVNKIN